MSVTLNTTNNNNYGRFDIISSSNSIYRRVLKLKMHFTMYVTVNESIYIKQHSIIVFGSPAVKH